jgi:hypothetical protein
MSRQAADLRTNPGGPEHSQIGRLSRHFPQQVLRVQQPRSLQRSQSLDGAQGLPVKTKEPVEDEERAEVTEAAEPEGARVLFFADDVFVFDLHFLLICASGQILGVPSTLSRGTDQKEMQVENKDVISEKQDPSTDEKKEEALVAAHCARLVLIGGFSPDKWGSKPSTLQQNIFKPHNHQYHGAVSAVIWE